MSTTPTITVTGIAIDATQAEFEEAVMLHLLGEFRTLSMDLAHVCVEAIEKMTCGELDDYIDLPEGVLINGDTSQPAWRIFKEYRLGEVVR